MPTTVCSCHGMANNTRNTDVYLEPGFEIRAFLSSNVALSATAGIVIGAADDPELATFLEGWAEKHPTDPRQDMMRDAARGGAS